MIKGPIRLRASAKSNKKVAEYVAAAKRGEKNQHVTPTSEGWQVKRAGSERATKQFETQAEAIAYARQIAVNQQAELFIHGRDGRIRERNSYGKDSFPPRG